MIKLEQDKLKISNKVLYLTKKLHFSVGEFKDYGKYKNQIKNN